MDELPNYLELKQTEEGGDSWHVKAGTSEIKKGSLDVLKLWLYGLSYEQKGENPPACFQFFRKHKIA